MRPNCKSCNINLTCTLSCCNQLLYNHSDEVSFTPESRIYQCTSYKNYNYAKISVNVGRFAGLNFHGFKVL